jgi:SanA protein
MFWFLSALVKGLWFILRSVLLLILIAVGGVGLLNAIVVFSTFSRIVSEVPEGENDRTALILGASPYGEFLQRRIETGAKLYLSGEVDQIFVTGDGRGPYYNEVESMTAMLQELGVPAEVIFGDPGGLRTYSSMQRAQEVYGLRRVVVVSQRFHNFRALYLARAHGLDAIAVDAQDPTTSIWANVHSREWLARPLAVWEVHFQSPPDDAEWAQD